GRRVGEIANAFGMRVIAHSPHRAVAPEWPGFAFVGIDELLAGSDIVSLNCPLTPQTRGLMDAERLAEMKRSALLLNLSRGPLVVESDLAAALRDRTIAGAAIDVLDHEPPRPDNPLLAAPNVTITPHIAWATHAARSRLLATASDNVRGYLTGQLQNNVN
ncbi:MAG TPA: NAD(P)-dependent oxidoreductase, partial [Spirochaetia bacterium]|nr:NAD(P)-dependent oxidoreductase [Spirochaetia bacterium]